MHNHCNPCIPFFDDEMVVLDANSRLKKIPPTTIAAHRPCGDGDSAMVLAQIEAIPCTDFSGLWTLKTTYGTYPACGFLGLKRGGVLGRMDFVFGIPFILGVYTAFFYMVPAARLCCRCNVQNGRSSCNTRLALWLLGTAKV